MPGGIELELKLRAKAEGPLRALAAAERLGAAVLGPPRVVDEVDRYLDSPAGDLARARWACRLRTREGRTFASLKGPAQHADGAALHRRPEVEGPAGSGLDPDAWPPSEARDLLLRMAGPGELVERVRLEQRRTERAALLGEEQIGILSLDVVRMLAAGRLLGVEHLVELELTSDIAPVAELAAALAVVPGLRPDPLSKLEHALAMLDSAGR